MILACHGWNILFGSLAEANPDREAHMRTSAKRTDALT